ncbi:protein CLEC16A homolog [Polistes fuscatus]|uniref:protein CLEC16A homolog n=1 Tax=Polistes fuscatus TaxID=30207 RepID=UPI001CA9A8A7|nr:protein CLEC16A homolog [Polistes fuscatus]
MLEVFKLINSLILILSILFQLTTSKPLIRSYNNISKINKELNNNQLNNEEEQMAILFNKTLDYLIPRRRLLDDHNSHNYSKLKGTQRSNISINTNENNPATSTWSSEVTVNTEYFSNAPIVYEDSTRVRRKRNALEDDNRSKFDEEHETDDKMNNKRSSSSSSSSDNDDSGDQSSNVDKSESDELEDYNEESNDNETDDQENVAQSKDTKTKRESSDYDYAEDQDNKSSNDVRVKRDETKQTNDKTVAKLEDENSKNNELASSNKIDNDKSKESDEKRDDLSDEKKLTKEEEENGEYEKRVEEKIKQIEGVDNLRDDDYRIAESIRESNIKKRFATEERSAVKGESIKNDDISMNKIPVIKKREKVRQMFIVKDDSDKRRRKKKKRKISDNEERELTFYPNLLRRNQRALDEKKVRIKRANARLVTFEYRPQNIEDEENDEGNEFGDDGLEDRTSNLKDRNSNSLIEDQEDKEYQRSQSDLRALASSPRDSNRRLITDYNEAFGGLQSLRDNPNGALTRFKRIKRVLQNSRTSHKNKLTD